MKGLYEYLGENLEATQYERVTNELEGRRFLEVAAKIDDFAAHGRDEKMCNLLLRAVVTGHHDDKLGSVSSRRRAEDGGHD